MTSHITSTGNLFLSFKAGVILIKSFGDKTLTIKTQFLLPPKEIEPVTFCLLGVSDRDDLPGRQAEKYLGYPGDNYM